MERKILAAVDALEPEMIEFAKALIDIPTVNPPGENYAACADLIADCLAHFGMDVQRVTSTGHRDHSERYPRHNVIGTWIGDAAHPLVHFNGHTDVVPPGDGWTRDPFHAVVDGNRLYGRGSSDMKAGLAAAIFAVAALRRAGLSLRGGIQVSATVDEESGGFAGVAHLAQLGLLTSSTIDYVIIPEPFGASRICVGHRGLYWFRVISYGRIAHGAMPYLGVNAIENMAVLIEELRANVLLGTLNINSIHGGQAGQEPQTPCVADRCEAIFDRRYLAEDNLQNVKAEILAAIDRVTARLPQSRFELEDYGNTVYPVSTPVDSELVLTLAATVRDLFGVEPALTASPGTYDHKHFTHIGNIRQCVAYGPGELSQAHQSDEWCTLDALVASCKVMAVAAARLVG
jgi:succinyl-diaminopimelate desuccinylase